MKIALFSPYLSQNYGTVLQAFALANVISSYGVKCEYIKWRHCEPTIIKRIIFLLRHPSYYFLHKKNKELNSTGLRYSFLSQPEYKAVIQKNTDFAAKNTPHTIKEYSYDDLNSIVEDYDRFIVGSDQTWNPSHIYEFSPYYLSFVKDTSKKYAYGCSLGRTEFSDDFINHLIKQLNTFSSLSCRERQNAKMLSDRIGKKVENVLDPTLLLSKSEWEQYMKAVDGIPNEYVLCYILGERADISEYAEYLSHKSGLPVYYILTRPCHKNHTNVLEGIGVQEFLWLIANCTYLVTDSYHGTIFSLNFEKNVISFDKHEGRAFDNGRIKDVLQTYGLTSHFLSSYKKYIPEAIDYVRVKQLLEANRTISLDYLKYIVGKREQK